MHKRVPKKGRAVCSLLTPSNVSLIVKDKSPKKSLLRKAKNTKSKSYGGTLTSDKTKNTSFSGSSEEPQAAATVLDECNATTPQETAEPSLRLQSRRKRSRKDNADLTVRKTKKISKSDNEKHSGTPLVIQKNEAELLKIDKQHNVEDNEHEELFNQTNSFNKNPNQSKSSTVKNTDLNLVDGICNSVIKNNRSTNFRNKRLDRDRENTYDESLLKLSRATKLTGTINKGRRNIERQQEKNLKNVTIRKRYPQSAIKSPNETIKTDEKKITCTPANLIRKPVLRKKMPDFSAIHQHNFGKMESIVDHLERKARRAIVLTTSTVKKAKPNKKKESIGKKSIVEHLGHKAKKTLLLTPTTTRIVNLDIKDSSSKKVSKSTSFVRQQVNTKSEPPTHTKDTQLKCVQKLGTKFDKIQSNKKSIQENANILPKLDTKFDKIKTNNKVIQENVNSLPKMEISKAKVEELNSRMLEKRGLYKGKIETGGGIRQKKNVEILRGVRSNRRFELQMKYRNSRD